jgi:hypothetical protein
VLDCVVGGVQRQILLLRARSFLPLALERLLVDALVVVGAVSVCRRRKLSDRCAILAAYHFCSCAHDFPLSGNHRYLEMAVYLTLAVVPSKVGPLLRYAILTISSTRACRRRSTATHASGEMFAIEAFHPPEALGNTCACSCRR